MGMVGVPKSKARELLEVCGRMRMEMLGIIIMPGMMKIDRKIEVIINRNINCKKGMIWQKQTSTSITNSSQSSSLLEYKVSWDVLLPILKKISSLY